MDTCVSAFLVSFPAVQEDHILILDEATQSLIQALRMEPAVSPDGRRMESGAEPGELAVRAEPRSWMRADLAAVFDPAGHKVRMVAAPARGDASIVALQLLGEGLGPAALKTAAGRNDPNGAESAGGAGDLSVDVGAAVVVRPFHGVRRFCRADAAFDDGSHQVAHHLA